MYRSRSRTGPGTPRDRDGQGDVTGNDVGPDCHHRDRVASDRPPPFRRVVEESDDRRDRYKKQVDAK